MIKIFLSLIFVALIGLTFSCSDPVTGTIENQPPETYLSLFPDSIIAPGSTLKKIQWWGDDPDGFVKGFRVSFDSVNWTFTTENDSTFVLSITGNDSTFRFYVAAVDDKDLVDKTPATNLYPVINTPPVVSFDAGTEIPDTTLPVASFKYTGSDPDGVESIRYYQWSLNDTINFNRVSGSTTLLTLTEDSGLVLNSNNILYLRAEDEAGAVSPIIRMPDTSSIWYVRGVTSNILMIRDIPSANIGIATAYFQNAFDTIQYDILDIKSNGGALIPKIINPMFVNTLKLFDIVFWTSGIGSTANAANFELAQNSLPLYIQSGGKVFFSSGFSGTGNSGQGNLINFAPVDSITSCSIPFYITGDNNLILNDNSYPVLGPSSNFSSTRGVYTTTGTVIYKLYKPLGCFDTLNVAIKDSPVNPRVIYFALPVYYLNNNLINSKALFRRIFIEEFGY
ncbi:MAG: hypothetical protein M3R36_04185 [Bacteroidota bacterium]|nr:hypothetical protein [Bacteroidota bacterium]